MAGGEKGTVVDLMGASFRRFFVLLSVAAGAAHANAEVDAAFEETMRRYSLPGLAVGIVEDGKVVYLRTEGELVAGEGAPITPDTLFKIASNTKSMTTATLARLVEAGKLRWDDPVVRHLPAFRMHDPWITREMQVRDLLIHNSGLRAGAGDLMFWPEPNLFDRGDVIAGLRHLKPIHSFRASYDYDNLMYIVAGEVAAAAGGAPYDALVRREVFEPLGMTRCRAGEWDRDAVGNVAQPHMLRDGRAVPIRRDGRLVPSTTMEAAGGIRCSLNDMLRWVGAWLEPDPAWLSREQRQALWTAHTPMPVSKRQRDWDNTHFHAYGYGWRLSDVDGNFRVAHTGTLAGMYSYVTLLPDRKAGFVILINGEGEDARIVLNQVLVKRYTAPESKPTVARYAGLLGEERAAEPASAKAPDTSLRRPATPGELAGSLGLYRDPWFGDVTICAHEGGVRFVSRKSPQLDGIVMQSRSRWLVDWRDETLDTEAWLDFAGATTDARTLRMAKVDPTADFSSDFEDLAFERVGDCEPVRSEARSARKAGMVDIRTLSPGIRLDLRYAGTTNFTGTRVAGYEAPRCFLQREAAQALARVEAAVRREGYALALFDCYRPRRAVAQFVAWAAGPDDPGAKSAYYPRVRKQDLLGDYIAPTSGHSRGATLDLTLLRCDDAGKCMALDMGTPFDFFDPRAHTDSPDVTPRQRQNRRLLRSAMRREGFRNYPLEWWHYTLEPEPAPPTSHDFPIR